MGSDRSRKRARARWGSPAGGRWWEEGAVGPTNATRVRAYRWTVTLTLRRALDIAQHREQWRWAQTWQCSQKNVERPPVRSRWMELRQRRQGWPSRS
jgi:hypothetical protein